MYFSKTLADNLYILQYPTRKADENANKAVILKSFVKPLNQEVKIKYKLDTASRHYDAFKGEQLAIAADGKVWYAPRLFSELFMIQAYFYLCGVQNEERVF